MADSAKRSGGVRLWSLWGVKLKPASLKQLVKEGRLERVPADKAAAKAMLQEAGLHLDSAGKVKGLDPSGAFALLYDGARKAITAHMLARGYRAINRPGAHAAVVSYVSGALKEGTGGTIVEDFDRIRRTRHRAEYESVIPGIRQIETDLKRARTIVDLVKHSWPS